MKELLTDLLEYMESRADADITGPNEAMRFQIRIEEALSKMEKPEPTALPAPNTVMWWLCRIADPKIRRKAVNTFDKFPLYKDSKESKNIINIDEAIDSIAWYDEANDLGAYFESLHRTNLPLLPEPDFTEYLELRKS